MNASRTSNWPSQLAAITGRSVYNLALPGFGPAQYWAQANDALARTPAVVIVQLFLGNDFRDAYETTYKLEHYSEWRAADPTLAGGRIASVDAAVDLRDDWGIVKFEGLWRHLAIGRLVFRWREQDLARRQVLEELVNHPDAGLSYDDGVVRTIITVADRIALLNSDTPQIAEGARLTLAYLDAIRRAAGERLRVLIFPTKASSFVVDDPRVRKVQALERSAADLIRGWCRKAGTPCLDPLPIFRAATSRGESLYPTTTENHPTAAGYRLVAESVAAMVSIPDMTEGK